MEPMLWNGQHVLRAILKCSELTLNWGSECADLMLMSRRRWSESRTPGFSATTTPLHLYRAHGTISPLRKLRRFPQLEEGAPRGQLNEGIHIREGRGVLAATLPLEAATQPVHNFRLQGPHMEGDVGLARYCLAEKGASLK